MNIMQNRNDEIDLFQELNGKPVQMNDRFETVHIWSKPKKPII